MTGKRLYTILLTCMLVVQSVLPQVTFKIQAPPQAEVGQRIRVSYVANTSDAENIQVDDFEGFDVLYGPSTSSSSSISMINGKTTRSSSLTFTYTLIAQKDGTFTLPAATISVDGKSYKSNTASIEVLPASDDAAASGQQGGTQRGAAAQRPRRTNRDGEITNDDLFMTVTASKTKIYEQEAVLLTYKLHTLVNVQQISGEIPQLDGFHVQELDSKSQMSLKYERVNGRNYGTAIWRQYVLYPQKSGKLKVPSVTFESQVEVINNSGMDPFDIFFGGGSLAQVVRKSIVAPAVELDVQPLPSPKPENFSGAVGKFSVSGSLTPQQLDANDAATLRLVLSGHGNMKLMSAPKVDFPKDFDVYDPKEEDKTVNTATGAKGNKIYDYIVVPRHAGKFDIAPVEFCYFDTGTNSYQTLKTEAFSLQVNKGKGGGSAIAHEQEDLKVINNDIRYIKRNKFHAEEMPEELFLGTIGYWLYFLLLPILFVITLTFSKRKSSGKLSGKGAGKAATKRLRNAAKLMAAHKSEAFYEEVMRALFGYAGDKLHITTKDLNKENVAQALAKHGVEESLITEYLDVLGECEFARFAPGDPNATMEKIFSQATTVINKLDGFIKKK